MPILEHEHQYYASLGVEVVPPGHYPRLALVGATFEEAQSHAESIAAQLRVPLNTITYYYRLHITASTDWVPVGTETNYAETLAVILDSFDHPTVINWPPPQP